MSVTSIVLDSSAVLAHLNQEPGSDLVTAALGRGVISSVNLAEVVAKLMEWQVPFEVAAEALSRYGLDIVSFDEALAYRSAKLRPKTKALGLSLGDRACLALAEQLGLPVLTADRAWSKLELSIDVRLIRET